jgi:hypothetical protein
MAETLAVETETETLAGETETKTFKIGLEWSRDRDLGLETTSLYWHDIII